MIEGVEPALAAFPCLEQHRAAAQEIVAADQELTDLELKLKEAKARLEAADKELVRLLTSNNGDSHSVKGEGLLAQEVKA
jgi:hypothetical protein